MIQSDICPRCSSKDVSDVADSPVAGIWKVYGCNKCNFLWRSSEEELDVKLPETAFDDAIWLFKGGKKPEMIRTRKSI